LRSRLCLVALIAAGCGVLSPEEQLLTDFFEASRLYDTTTIAKMSSVTFNPRTDGVVQDFEIETVTAEGDSRRLTVQAAVRSGDGQVSSRTLSITLARKDGRWFITGLRGGP
jgi:hypothetical protein